MKFPYLKILFLVLGMLFEIFGTDLGTAAFVSQVIPINISDGTGTVFTDVVTGIVINDSSVNGWTITITSSNGSDGQPKLKNTINNSTIDYNLEINNISGTLADGLTLSPSANSVLNFINNYTVITTSGSATGSTVGYSFDLRMRIEDSATIGKLAGDYRDNISIELSSGD